LKQEWQGDERGCHYYGCEKIELAVKGDNFHERDVDK
jgi:hypothetical protein